MENLLKKTAVGNVVHISFQTAAMPCSAVKDAGLHIIKHKGQNSVRLSILTVATGQTNTAHVKCGEIFKGKPIHGIVNF